MTGSLDDAAAPARPAVRPTRIPIEPKVTDAASDAEDLADRVAQVAKGGARAAVLGINDGLVTNICLILAVAGANASRSTSGWPGLPAWWRAPSRWRRVNGFRSAARWSC